jgi:hypothetical protein
MSSNIPKRPQGLIGEKKSPQIFSGNQETNAIPATVTAELIVSCGGPDRPASQHRIWIHRDGTVSTPDHFDETESTAEKVAVALDNNIENICKYWSEVPSVLNNDTKKNPPNIESWNMRLVGLWTSKSVWTAMTGILGYSTHTLNTPILALAYMKVYKKYGGLPSDAETHLSYLTSPWIREGGWRKTTPVPPKELADILEAGIPVDRAASAAVLGLTKKETNLGVTLLKKYRMPPDLLLQIAYVVNPDRLESFLNQLDEQKAKMLPSRLSKLKENIKTTVYTQESIEDFLLA